MSSSPIKQTETDRLIEKPKQLTGKRVDLGCQLETRRLALRRQLGKAPGSVTIDLGAPAPAVNRHFERLMLAE
jgi:hypothetical protein